ncbi:hypothetical protein BGZ80_000937 [Entomortierella chlamydospora]|uniref:HECT-type E3 ubiquitin transferase n=1 Tax=Entomortierella chlamydospora TaxID=101097 RepID=A0A9P6MRH8_9FUNG|nr:hypothetical protein BGZ80_000937 [Entomortierella chlamydospora]
MFDGSFKSRRTINLGGNKQQIDKQKLLRQAQEERRIREAERKQQKAAENIQAWYRGRTVAIKVRQDLRASWDQNISALLQSTQASPASPSSSVSIEQLSQGIESVTQKFLIFYRSQHDHQRLVQLCTLLQSPVSGTKSRFATIPFQLPQCRQSGWDVLLARLLPVLVRHLSDYPTWPENDSAPVLTLLDILTIQETFQVLGDSSLSSKLPVTLSRAMSGSGAIEYLARFLSRIVGDQSQEGSSTLDQLIVHILPVPLLPNRMSIESLTTFTSRLPLESILQRLSSTSCSSIVSLPLFRITPLVANILAFCYQRVSRMSPAVSSAYLRALTILLGMIPQDSIERAPKRAANDDEDMDDIEWRSEELPGATQSPTSSSNSTNLDPRILKWLSLAHDSNHLNDILGSIEPSSTPSDTQQEVLSTESVGQITQLLLNLITLFPSHKINILSNLMYFRFGGKVKQVSNPGSGKFFGISIIKIFLDAFMGTALYGQLLRSMEKDKQLSVQLVLDPAHEKSWSLLAFVSELYCQILVTMGDDEFHDESRNPISLSSVITLSSIVRDVSFLLWWNDNALDMELNLGGSKNLKVGYLRDIDRVAIFREFVESDRERTPGSSTFHPHAIGQARIRRGAVFEDGYDQLNNLGSRLKGRIAISFIDQYGMPEAGIDGGGVFKEFLTCLAHQAFDTNYGLFMNTTDQLLYPNPHSYAKQSAQLKHYEFLGRILGKALYEGILIDAAFAGFFLAKCLGQVNYLDDLPSLDPELYRGLMHLKNYDGNFEDLSLDFTVADEEMGQSISRNLVPNGNNIQVTRENRIRYIYLMAHYRLNTQIDQQCRAFFHGLSDLIDPRWLWMFNQQELQVMLGGAQTPISLKDLEENVVYSNFQRTDPTIEYFWSVVQEMGEEDRRLLIKFITSCARPPLLGFGELNPKLCIRNAGQEEDRLPTSSTCMNLLKLPAFTSRQRLKEKLLYAIHSEAGFDLS